MSERNDSSDDHSDSQDDKSNVDDPIELAATAISPSGRKLGILIKAASKSALLPLGLTVLGKVGALEEWLVNNELDFLIGTTSRKDFGTYLRNRAQDQSVVVIDQPGAHYIQSDDSACWVYAWDGKLWQLSGDTCPDIELAGEAATPISKRGSVRAFIKTVGRIAKGNPRVIVALCFALSAAHRRVFGEPVFSLFLLGPSSHGKSSTQKACSALVGPPTVEAWDATRNAMKEVIEPCGDRPVCIDDVHLADKWDDVENILMAAGNSANRKRSRFSTGDNQTMPLNATPILSSNRSLEQLRGNSSVPDQVWARVFVVRTNELTGMFDRTGKYQDGAAVADALERVSNANFGKFWGRWLAKLSGKRTQLAKRFPVLRDDTANRIAELAGATQLSPVNGRVLKRLAFVAAVGRLASKLGMLTVGKDEVIAAFGELFAAHLETAPKLQSELEDEIVRQLGEHIERNLRSFPDSSTACSVDAVRGLLGYSEDLHQKGRHFLWLPEQFRHLFESKFGPEIYKILASRGLLLTQKGRHNLYEKRMTVDGRRVKKFFIAISASILYSSKG